MARAGAGSSGRLPGAPRIQAQDQQQQGRGEGQARVAERPRQPRLRPEAAHARVHVFRCPDCAQIRVAGVSFRAARLRDSARAQEADQAVAPPGCHRGPSLKVPGLPSPGTPPPPATRTAPLATASRLALLERGAAPPTPPPLPPLCPRPGVGRKKGSRRGGRG